MEAYLADCIGISPDGSDMWHFDRLAKFIFEQSQGNPCTVEEFYNNGVIYYTGNKWTYCRTKLAQCELSDNIYGLMNSRMNKLPTETKFTLRVASCLGCNFPLKIKLEIINMDGDRLDRILEPAIRSGLASIDDDVFSFAHDRVLEPKEKSVLHYKIGVQLLEGLKPYLADEDHNHLHYLQAIVST